MLCPSCKQPLIVLELDNIEVDYCASCEGVWFEASEYALILSGSPDTEGMKLVCGGSPGKRPCPACSDRMDVSIIPDTDIELDHCPREHGVWFDRGELLRFIDTKLDRQATVRLRQFCEKLFARERVPEKPSWQL